MRITTLILFFLLALPVLAQQPSRSDLENRRKQIMESIRETEEQLEATKKDKNATIGQLRALQNKLAERQNLIGNINDEIGEISSNIQSSSNEVVRLRENLELLKTRYAQTLRYAYETRSSYDMLAFLFSSGNFNDAVRRMKYLKKFRDYRKGQVEQIRVTQGQIQHKIGILNSEKAQKDELLTAQVQQKQVLEKETNETNGVVKDLKGKEKQLLSNIEKNRKSAKQLDHAISDIIRREIEIARKKAEDEQRRRDEAAKKAALAANANNNASNTSGNHSNIKTNSSYTTTTIINNPPHNIKNTHTATPNNASAYSLSLTPEVAALSNSFQANRGKLPWPVEKGFIAEPFGKHPHAVEGQVEMDNKGIEIQTSPGAVARAVFDGTVTSVAYIPGMGQFVLITHGQFFTVYSRLSNISVKIGDKVHLKQTLGTVIMNEDNVPLMHFELWKVGANNVPNAIDPSAWIAH